MGASVAVSEANFAAEVLGPCEELPIIVDFFATWCGPCKVLKPTLERLAMEYGVMLATVDIDQNPELASQYGVEGVPDVRIATAGRLQPGFVGAVPEGQIREILARYELRSELETTLAAAQGAIAARQFPEAKALFDTLFERYPDHPGVTLEAARFLILLQQFEDAERLLNSIPPDQAEHYKRAQGVKSLMRFQQWAAADPSQGIGAAAQGVLQGEYETALQQFLAIVEAGKRDKDTARQGMVDVFALLGSQHPLTRQYQQALMMALY
jgi:putative thioredoxin